MRGKCIAAVAAVGLVGGLAGAQTGSLTTGPDNNSSGGIFMDLTALNGSLAITSFEIAYAGTVGTPVEVEVWVRDGSYQGFDADPFAWTLHETATGTRQGTGGFDPLVLTNEIVLETNQVRGVYLHALAPALGQGIRYNGTASNPPQTLWSNSDLQLFSDVARTGGVPFEGGRFTPRCFAGTINYNIGGPTCRPDLNGDGVVDADDFFLFLQLFASGDPRADFNNDGVIDADDFFLFLNAFALGC